MAYVVNVVYETPGEEFFTTTEVAPTRAEAERRRLAALHHTLIHPAARPVDAYVTAGPVGRFRRSGQARQFERTPKGLLQRLTRTRKRSQRR